MVDPVGATLAVCGAGQALDLQLHSGATHRIRPSRSRRFSSAAGCEGSLSHRQSSHFPVLVEDRQPNPTEDPRSSTPQETQSTCWSESEPKSIGSVRRVPRPTWTRLSFKHRGLQPGKGSLSSFPGTVSCRFSRRILRHSTAGNEQTFPICVTTPPANKPDSSSLEYFSSGSVVLQRYTGAAFRSPFPDAHIA
jgi:hypothetical protein